MRQREFISERLPLSIIAQSCCFFRVKQYLGHGLHRRGFQFIQLPDMGQDLIKIVLESADLFVREPQIGEIRDVSNFVFSNLQAWALFRDAL